MSKSSSAYVGVHDDVGLIYVLVDTLEAFKAIPLPAQAGKCLSKSMEQGELRIIFQYWETK
ncbi:MAG TPA: hypothetical protein VF795_11775 [Desulfuromonadaceae bacterium]